MVAESSQTKEHGNPSSLVAEQVFEDTTALVIELSIDFKPEHLDIDGSNVTDVITELREYNAAFYNVVFNGHAFDGAEPETIEHIITILMKNQKAADSLEPLALSQQLGSENPVALIVKAGNSNTSSIVFTGHEEDVNPPLLYQEGAPWLIAVANPETGSAYQQLAAVIRSVTTPLLEIDSGQHFLSRVILFGSVVYNPRLPGDIDLLVLYDDNSPLPTAYAKVETPLSATADKLLWELTEQHDAAMTGRAKMRFALVGDTITAEHFLDVTFVRVSDFLRRYDATGDNRERLLKTNKDAYKNLGLTFPEALIQTGGMIIYGEEIKDSDGRTVLSKRDDNLLKT